MKAFGKKILTGITAMIITVSGILASTGNFVSADDNVPMTASSRLPSAKQTSSAKFTKMHPQYPLLLIFFTMLQAAPSFSAATTTSRRNPPQ